MATTPDKGYTVEIKQIKGIGSPWIVRVHKKYFLFKRTISSDWFLDQEQAHRFAHQLSAELTDSNTVTMLKNRKPGWTLHRAAR